MRIARFWFLAAATAWPVRVLAQNSGGARTNNGYMDGYGHGYMMGPWSGAFLMWIPGLILLILLIYFLVRTSGTGGSKPTPDETPLDILKKRYARGEITKEQFDEIKKDL